jgi:hypothetical protein
MHLYEHDRQDRAIAMHAIHAGGACVTKAGLMTNPLLVHILALVTTDVVRFCLASCSHAITMRSCLATRDFYPWTISHLTALAVNTLMFLSFHTIERWRINPHTCPSFEPVRNPLYVGFFI